MSLSSEINTLWSRDRALKRKLARPLVELHLQRMAEELCLEWTCSQADRQPFPNSQAFAIRVAGSGYRLHTFTAVVRYLERCRAENQLSGPWAPGVSSGPCRPGPHRRRGNCGWRGSPVSPMPGPQRCSGTPRPLVTGHWSPTTHHRPPATHGLDPIAVGATLLVAYSGREEVKMRLPCPTAPASGISRRKVVQYVPTRTSR